MDGCISGYELNIVKGCPTILATLCYMLHRQRLESEGT